MKKYPNTEMSGGLCPSIVELDLIFRENKASQATQKHIDNCKNCLFILDGFRGWEEVVTREAITEDDLQRETRALSKNVAGEVLWHNIGTIVLRAAAVVLLVAGFTFLVDHLARQDRIRRATQNMSLPLAEAYDKPAKTKVLGQLATKTNASPPLTKIPQKIIAPALSDSPKGTLHLIVIGNTTHNQIITKANLKQLHKLTKRLPDIGMKVNEIAISSQQKIMSLPDIVHKLKVNKNDVCWIYYTGEGENTTQARSIHDNYYHIFGMHATLKSLETLLDGKQARLKLVTADYQNNQADEMVLMPTNQEKSFDPKVLRQLFMKEKGKITLASQTNLARYYASKEGSLLINSLVNSLGKVGKNQQAITWEGLCQEAGRQVFQSTQNIFPGQQAVDYHISSKP